MNMTKDIAHKEQVTTVSFVEVCLPESNRYRIHDNSESTCFYTAATATVFFFVFSNTRLPLATSNKKEEPQYFRKPVRWQVATRILFLTCTGLSIPARCSMPERMYIAHLQDIILKNTASGHLLVALLLI